MDIAIVTMVNDESFFLPLWINHYSKFPDARLIVVDHGSTDGCADNLPENIDRIRIPQSKPYVEMDRSNTISDLQHSLLHYYDYVIYTDVDEFLVVDPKLDIGLTQLIKECPSTIIAPIGLNVVHRCQTEPDIDPTKPILAQRPHAYFHSNYCKPMITAEPVTWMRGFHGCTGETFVHEGLFLFHMQQVDKTYARERMKKRNFNLLEAKKKPGFAREHDKRMSNWEASDAEVVEEFEGLNKMPFTNGTHFDFETLLQEAKDSSFQNYFGNITRIGVRKGFHLHKIPDRFLNEISGLQP